MPNIPRDCAVAMEMVQDLSRDTLLEMGRHPGLNVFQCEEERKEPFFERAMIMGSCLAVEHNIDVQRHVQDQRRSTRITAARRSDSLESICKQMGAQA